MSRHHAIAGSGADDDGVVIREFSRRGNRRILIDLIVRGFRDIRRNQFRHPFDRDLRAAFARTFSRRLGHFLHVTIGRIIQHQHFNHVTSPYPDL